MFCTSSLWSSRVRGLDTHRSGRSYANRAVCRGATNADGRRRRTAEHDHGRRDRCRDRYRNGQQHPPRQAASAQRTAVCERDRRGRALDLRRRAVRSVSRPDQRPQLLPELFAQILVIGHQLTASSGGSSRSRSCCSPRCVADFTVPSGISSISAVCGHREVEVRSAAPAPRAADRGSPSSAWVIASRSSSRSTERGRLTSSGSVDFLAQYLLAAADAGAASGRGRR